MANTTIQLRYSTETGNVPVSLANGEIAINTYDGKLFYADPTGTVQEFSGFPGPSGLDGEIQFNDSGVLGSDSGLTYNKTTDVITIVGGAIVGGINVVPQIASAFLQANTPSHVANSAASYANSAFARANNSLDANNGGTVTGTITANSFITTGSYGNILGANVIYANTFIANTGYIQFADGSKQYTANAGSGVSEDTYARDTANAAFIHANSAFDAANTSTGGNSFGVIYTSNNSTFANAETANDQVNFVGESGVVVFANAVTKTITVAGTPGAQGLTVDYGSVVESINYTIDYGSSL